jgi:SAM-dependent methyltransferase
MGIEVEDRLRSLVEKWTSHMAWRADFQQWRHHRMWQERFQHDHIAQIDWASGGEIAGKKVLDLGCGMGGLSVALMLLGAKVFSMDPNWDYLEITKLRGRRYGLQVSAVQGVGEDLPFEGSSFDAVLAFDVLEHCSDPQRVLMEIYRVLRAGKWALVTVTNRFAFRDPHYHLPLVNWLPRSLGSTFVRLRPKCGYQALDRQALDAMHYFGWQEFVSLAHSCGFLFFPLDLRIRSRGIKGVIGDVAEKLGIYRSLYHIYRLAFRGTWTFKLVKPVTLCS